jgi:hypothetical protein
VLYRPLQTPITHQSVYEELTQRWYLPTRFLYYTTTINSYTTSILFTTVDGLAGHDRVCLPGLIDQTSRTLTLNSRLSRLTLRLTLVFSVSRENAAHVRTGRWSVPFSPLQCHTVRFFDGVVRAAAAAATTTDAAHAGDAVHGGHCTSIFILYCIDFIFYTVYYIRLLLDKCPHL